MIELLTAEQQYVRIFKKSRIINLWHYKFKAIKKYLFGAIQLSPSMLKIIYNTCSNKKYVRNQANKLNISSAGPRPSAGRIGRFWASIH